jgi:peptidoglycan/xylan/chitin deacetylase (PgdA/CDA1 family)
VRGEVSTGVAAVAAWWALPAPAMHVRPVARVLGLACRTALDGAVALTFDDGPHPQGTPAVLEALAAGGARATFFVVGEQAERHPSLVAEIAAAGHSVAVHGHRHRNLLRITPRGAADDLERAVAAIGDVAPVHRPPYGIYSAAALRAVRERGWTPLLWSRWGRDWRARATPATVVADATRGGFEPGDVILLHDADHYSAPGCWRATASAIPRILDAIAGASLRTAALHGPQDVYGR